MSDRIEIRADISPTGPLLSMEEMEGGVPEGELLKFYRKLIDVLAVTEISVWRRHRFD
jgi:hypothetical protein